MGRGSPHGSSASQKSLWFWTTQHPLPLPLKWGSKSCPPSSLPACTASPGRALLIRNWLLPETQNINCDTEKETLLPRNISASLQRPGLATPGQQPLQPIQSACLLSPAGPARPEEAFYVEWCPLCPVGLTSSSLSYFYVCAWWGQVG
jgi:hypothetical protein